MKLIKPSYEILTQIDPIQLLKNIEIAGRTCYKSEEKITEDSASKFVPMLLARGHESVLEHQSFTVKFICDRGVSHEIVRHRLASFSQESTRYCNYSNDKFDGLTFIIPEWCNNIPEDIYSIIWKNKIGTCLMNEPDMSYADSRWFWHMALAERDYLRILSEGWRPEQARSILPNSLKTEIVVTANIREWRTIFKQRTSKNAHPQMRELMCPLLDKIKEMLPELFSDIQ